MLNMENTNPANNQLPNDGAQGQQPVNPAQPPAGQPNQAPSAGEHNTYPQWDSPNSNGQPAQGQPQAQPAEGQGQQWNGQSANPAGGYNENQQGQGGYNQNQYGQGSNNGNSGFAALLRETAFTPGNLQQQISNMNLLQQLTLGGLGGALLLLIGSFGTWATATSAGFGYSFSVNVSGLQGDGVFTLLLSLIYAAALAIPMFVRMEPKARGYFPFAAICSAGLAALTVLIAFLRALTTTGVGPGWGLILAVIGAAAMLTCAILAFMKAPKIK